MPNDKRPPKDWWEEKTKEVKEGNPDYSEEQVDATVGHIWWHNMSESDRKKKRKGTMLKQAIRRLADDTGGQESEPIVYKKNGPGKFSNNVDERVYEDVMDGGGEDIGDEAFGLYTLIEYDPPMMVTWEGGETEPVVAAILTEDDQGFVDVDYFDDLDQAHDRWEALMYDYDDFAHGEGGDEDL